MHAGRLLVLGASLACVAVTSTIGAQDFFPATGRAAVNLIARPAHAIARVYVSHPPEGAWSGNSSYLYFVGEPLTLEMELWNHAGVRAVLVADDPARGVTVRVRRQEGDDGWFGGRIVDVPVRYHERPDRVYQGVVQPQPLDRRMPLAPDEAIRWSADVDLDAMEPGLYVFQLTPAITEESGIYVSANTAIAFEVRARTPDAAREIMLRAGRRAMHQADYAEAERLFHEMRAAFPDSAAATRSLALIYELQKRPREAREMLERTRAILAAGADVALTTHREEYRGEALARQLRALDEQIERLPR